MKQLNCLIEAEYGDLGIVKSASFRPVVVQRPLVGANALSAKVVSRENACRGQQGVLPSRIVGNDS